MTTDKNWLTVPDAVKYTKKSVSTIRRLIGQMNSHQQKKHLRTEPHRGKTRYLLDRSFLDLKFGDKEEPNKTEQANRTSENQLEKKDQQINRLHGIIEDLGERNKELHILLQTEQKRSISLQDKLNQIEGPKEEPAETQNEEAVNQTDPKHQDKPKEEGTQPPTEQEQKKDLPQKEVPANVGLFGKDISNTSALILMVLTISILMVIGILVLGN